MSSPKPKGPTPIVVTGGRFRRSKDIPATSTSPDPYQPNEAGISTRQGQDVNTRKTRAQFRQIEFQRAIMQHGYYLVWSKAVICPCINPATKQVQINCSSCDGSGFFYTDPMRIRGIMTALERNQRVFEKFGAWVEGTSNLTVEPMYRIGYRDRIEMSDSVMPFSELFQKGDRRGLRSQLPDRHDSLRFRIERITRVIWKPEGEDPQALEEGYHFEVSSDGWIHWLEAGENLVLDGDYLSAVYEYHPIYLVMSHQHAVRDGIVETKVPEQAVIALPVQAVVKLDYLSDINTPLPSMCERFKLSEPGPS